VGTELAIGAHRAWNNRGSPHATRWRRAISCFQTCWTGFVVATSLRSGAPRSELQRRKETLCNENKSRGANIKRRENKTGRLLGAGPFALRRPWGGGFASRFGLPGHVVRKKCGAHARRPVKEMGEHLDIHSGNRRATRATSKYRGLMRIPASRSAQIAICSSIRFAICTVREQIQANTLRTDTRRMPSAILSFLWNKACINLPQAGRSRRIWLSKRNAA
jgi:hypothetical protein